MNWPRRCAPGSVGIPAEVPQGTTCDCGPKAAAKQYGWKSRPAFQGKQPGRKATGRGIAWVNRDGSRVATIADVVVDRDDGGIWVKRVVVAHDCGLVISPDGMRNQIEGNVIQSMSRTLHEEITFDRAHVTSRDWASYPILRFNEIPDSIEMMFVNNTARYPSNGGGEPSTCPTAAVISNAVYDATGVRLRETPSARNASRRRLPGHDVPVITCVVYRP